MPQFSSQQSFRKVMIRNIALPLVTGLISSAVFIFLINMLVSQNKEVERTDRIIALANAGMKQFVDGETGIRGYALTGNESFLEPYISAKSKTPVDLVAMKELVSDNKIQVDRITSLEGTYANWLEYAENIRKLRADNKNVSTVVAQGLGKSMMDQSRDLFDRIIVTEERLRKERSDSLNRMTEMVLAIVITLTLVISIWIALFGRRQMLDLSGSYERILKASEDRNSLLQHQQWLKTGQTELSEKMAAQRSLKDLSETVITYLSQYLGAQVGAFYTKADENTLERTATYAFSRQAAPGKTFAMGETLVGQAAVQKKQMHLKNVPVDYIKISSSLGESAASELVITPVLDEDDELLSVIELGFLIGADARHDDFLKTVSETISVAIKTQLYREQREKLLKEIQNQTEELQTQQEELRVMNEELEEQTRMLKGSQARLEAQHAEMEQTNAQLEKQAQTLENQKDLLDRRNESLAEAKASLEQKALELQRASQYKSEFLANMSHELRTPLNSSLILAKLLSDNKDKNLTNQQVEFSQQILNSGNDLLNLINDILDLSKVESGKLDINPENVVLDQVVGGLKKAFLPVAQDKGLELVFEVGANAPPQLFTDRLRLEQILKNLISNAIKFTPKGSVVVRVLSIEEKICFEVKDTGIGIRKEQQEVIFEAFRQADGTTNRKFGGTGLGLSISKDLGRLLGGEIRVKSALNEGSTFSLIMPKIYQPKGNEAVPEAIPREHQALAPAKSARFVEDGPWDKDRRAATETFFPDDRDSLSLDAEPVILVVEDDKKFAQILFDLAHENKYKCVVTDSAEDAVELAKKYRPRAVLLDFKLSGQNGLFALDQLKHHSETRHIPVHVISAQDVERQALHLGAIGYLMKPVRREQLIEAFGKIEVSLRQGIRKVLVVEDNEIQRNAIQKLIEDKSLETVAAETGEKAFNLLSNNSFDCMIMDLNLPDMSGFDLLEKMNASANQSYPPIIVYTGRSLSREEEIKLNRYSKAVIIKGAKSPERLLDEVTLFLHRVESRLDEKKKDILENLRNREKIFESKNIMIVDDDMRNTFALTAALEQKGANILIAKNGEEALAKLTEEVAVDIVLMDIMMPIMDGYEAISEIRRNPKFRKLPIIALTAKAMKDDQQKCLEVGANDYLSKPVDLDKLLSLIRIWLTAGWS